MAKSDIEDLMHKQIIMECQELPVREYQFAAPRRWRFDFSWPSIKLAVEVHGGIWIRGRHTRPDGFSKDLEKMNEAQIMGWRVLQFTRSEVESGAAIESIIRAMVDNSNVV
jgi:very-short-patch-repair endonuclease